MTRILAVGNQKGGTGKTTTVLNLGAELANRGRVVVLVDADPQASLTESFGIDAEGESLAEVLGGTKPGALKLSEVLREVGDGLALVPSDIALSYTELGLVQRIAGEFALRGELSVVSEQVDYIIVDCPPSLGLLTVNALVAADRVLIPAQAEYLALRGLTLFWETLRDVKPLNPALQVFGVLPTFVRRTRHHDEILALMREAVAARVLDAVPLSVKASEGHAVGKPISALDAENPVAEAYRQLAAEVDANGW